MTTVQSYCRLCTAMCGLTLDVVDGRVERAQGDREHPLTAGFTCVKGRHIHHLHSDPSRFVTAQRRGGSGKLEPVDTDEAIAEVGAALRDILERHGPDAIGLFAGTYSHLIGLTRPALMAFWEALGSRKYFSTITLDQAAKRVTARRLGRWQGGLQRFADSDVWMFVGHNPLVSMLGRWQWGFPAQNGVRQLREAKARGMQVIVVDPRRTETAGHADIHLQLRPGTDAILLAGFLHVIFEEGLEDRDFCARHVDGLDALRAAVRDVTPAFAAARTDVPAEDIVAAARCFANARKGMISTGTGANMGRDANLVEHLAASLNVVCGRWARAGEPFYQTPVLGPAASTPREAVTPPDRSWEREGWRSRVRGGTPLLDGEVPASMLPDEILDPGADRVRALIVVGGNPAAAIPDQQRTVDALSQLELLVSIEPYPNETAQLSHYVLPPALCLETAEHTGLKEAFFDVPFSQYTEAILDPPPGVREDWVYAFALARELELEIEVLGKTYAPGDPLPSSEELLAAATRNGRVSLDEIKRHPHGRLYDELPPLIVQPADDDGARFELLPGDVARELADGLGDVADDARPFRLIVRRMKGTCNTTGRRVPGFLKAPHNPCSLNPEDLAELGLADGDLVRVTSEHGSVAAVVQGDRTLRRGAVSLPHVFGDLPGNDDDPRVYGTNSGRLLSAVVDVQPVSGQPWMTAVPVSIEPLATAAAG